MRVEVRNTNKYEYTNYELLNSFIRRYLFLVLSLFISSFSIAQKSPSSISDLKKKAEKFFNQEKYEDAVPLYSQLLSLESQSPVYNYRYGVCLLYTGKDKTQAAVFLESAARFPSTKPEVHLYLGISYMYAEHYREAIAQFEEYKKTNNASKEGKLKADRLIKNCNSAVELNKDRKNITITDQKQVNRNTFYSNYDFSEASGKMLTATANFLSPVDKEKGNVPVMFMTNDGQTIYYASYGKKGDHGKDIYKAVRISGDKWSEPANLSDKINTDEDEDYPYLDRDGKTLYFCSKGHNSIGGYDIFKSVYDFANNEWSEPVNIGIPINTPDDDILYVPNLTGDLAIYSTAVESEFGKIEIREIRLSDAVANVAIIKGIYVSQDQAMRHDARITVVNGSNNGVVTSIHTNPRTGEYELVLPPGDDYMLVVEGGSYLPHAENFSLPPVTPGLSLKQKVMMDKNATTEKMTLSNFFNAPLAASSAPNQGNQINQGQDSLIADVPTEVKSSELNVASLDSSKLTPVTIDGKVVYVASPSATTADKNIATISDDNNKSAKDERVSLSKSATSNENISNLSKAEISRTETQEAKEEKTYTASKNKNLLQQENAPDSLVMEKQNTKSIQDSANENENIVDASNKNTGEETKQENDVVHNSEPVITAKTSNSELVKMCFTEAYSLKEEAATAKEQSKQKTEEGKKLDSLAKSQASQAEQLLSSNKELSKQLFGESKETATQAEVKMKEADALATVATEKEKEADEASKEASQLMTSLNVDTQTVAYHSALKSKEKKGAEKRTSNQPVASLKDSTLAETDKSQSIDDNNKNPDELNTNTSPKTHIEKANDLKSESESLASRSDEVKQDAKATTDKKEKSDFQKQAKDLKKQSEVKKLEAAKEFALAKKEEKETEANVKQQPTNSVPEKNSVVSKTTTNDSLAEITTQPSSTTNTTTQQATIDPQAALHFQTYSEKINQSKETDRQADEIDKQILAAHNSKERYSLTTKSNDLRHLAVVQWQQGQTELVLAKGADPDIEDKMKATKESSVAISTPEIEEKKSAPMNQDSSNERETITAQQQDNSKAVAKSDEIKDNNPVNKIANIEKRSATPLSGQSPENNSQKTSALQASPSPENESLTTTTIDTTRPEYPKYKELLSQIDSKQTETVNVFIEGMQINKKAIAVKEEELRLRDSAQVEPNAKKKEQLLVQADSVKVTGDSLIKISNEKLSTAQKNTRVVKDLTAQSEELKSKLIFASTQSQQPAMVADNNPTPVESSEKTNFSSSEKRQPSSKQTTDNVPVASKEGATASMTVENTSTNEKPSEINSEPTVSEGDLTLNQSQELKSTSQPAKDIVAQKSSDDNGKANTESKFASQNSKLDGSNIEPSNGNTSETSPSLKKTDGSNKLQTPNSKSETLNKQVNKSDVAKNKPSSKPVESASLAEAAANTSSPVSSPKAVLPSSYSPSDAETFTVSKTPSYNTDNKIPMDPSLPEGLVFKVQIGAFKSPLPKNAFGGLQPLSGETSRPGWIRYCLGLFRSFEPANLLKKDVQGLGYRDAFVVAYLNGKRISLNEAYQAMNKASAEEKKMYADISEKELKHLAKFDISSAKMGSTPDKDSKSFYGTTDVAPADLVEYAVQVGAYKSSKVPSRLTSLLPLNTEKTTSGLYRFTTGRFSNYSSADSMKHVAVTTGVKDAFIVVYKGGSVLSRKDATAILKNGKSVASPTTANNLSGETVTTPTPPPSNSPILPSPSDIFFKVQLGAYRENVPMNVVNSFLTLIDKGITQETDARGYHIFYIGKYKSYDEAIAAKNDVVARGVKDAFVTAFANEKRISVNEAQSILKK